jgi:inhibitor of KinA sporulation pathway (predicted exonuclease)
VIHDAMAALTKWLSNRDALAVTCGDWDLKTMWPRQVGLEPTLQTPPLFRRWCNLKHPFRALTGNNGGGMMAMLTAMGLAHEGRHHRGADDVANICRIVIAMLGRGLTIEATWADEQRAKEHAQWRRKWSETQAELRAREQALAALPAEVSPAVRAQLEATVARLERDVVRLQAQRDVFAQA